MDEKPVPLLQPDKMEELWGLTERPGKDVRARRDAAILRLFLATGIRRGEMAALKIEDLDLNAQLVYVGGKGRKYRNVPYSSAAAIALDRYLALRPLHKCAQQTDRVWLGIKGHMTGWGIDKVVENAGKRIGVELSPHQLSRNPPMNS